MEIVLGVSNRHVHLSKEDYFILFHNEPLKVDKLLIQPNQFASNQYVTIKTKKSRIENVRLIGPIRDYTQVEISKTDAYKLGINPPIRDSGDLKEAAQIEIIGPFGSVVKNCCIMATRHIHITKQMREKIGLQEVSEVAVSFEGKKGIIFDHVLIKECLDANLELHLDTDDANAGLLKTGDKGRIIKKQ